MGRLSNGTVLPSSLVSVDTDSDIAGFNHTYKNTALKAGVIVKRFDIDDDENVSKLTPEYDVMVVEQDANRATTTIQYRKCPSVDSFGSIADYFEHTYRAPTKTSKNLDLSIQNGAFVLLLCLDGSNEKAIIIGGIKHPSRNAAIVSNGTPQMQGEFNGLRWTIDEDGSLDVLFRGPTDAEGLPQNFTAGGTTFSIQKDGSVEINDSNLDAADSASNRLDSTGTNHQLSTGALLPYEKIRIDKTLAKIQMQARNNIELQTNMQYNLSADIGINLTTKINYMLSAIGDATTGCLDYNVNAKASVNYNTKFYSVNTDIAKMNTKIWNVNANQTTISSNQIAIGSGGVELLEILSQTLELLSTDLGNLGYQLLNADRYATLKLQLDTIRGSL